jgi:hypothetical protein
MERTYRGFIPEGKAPKDLPHPIADYCLPFGEGTLSHALVVRHGYKTPQYYRAMKLNRRFAEQHRAEAYALILDINESDMGEPLMSVFKGAAQALDILPGPLKGLMETCPLAYRDFISALFHLLERAHRYKHGDRTDCIVDLEKKLADVLKFENYVTDPRMFPESDSEPVPKRQRA